MRILYYFLKDIKTGKKTLEITDVFLGDIDEHIILRDIEYVIVDWTEEFQELELPEDFKY